MQKHKLGKNAINWVFLFTEAVGLASYLNTFFCSVRGSLACELGTELSFFI